MNSNPRPLTVSEVAKLLGLDASQVRRLCEAQRFPGALRYPGHRGLWTIPPEAIQTYREWAEEKRENPGRGRGRPPKKPRPQAPD